MCKVIERTFGKNKVSFPCDEFSPLRASLLRTLKCVSTLLNLDQAFSIRHQIIKELGKPNLRPAQRNPYIHLR